MQKCALDQPCTDTQIKKLFFHYAIRKTEGESTVNLLSTFEILFPVLELVLINFFSHKLS